MQMSVVYRMQQALFYLNLSRCMCSNAYFSCGLGIFLNRGKRAPHRLDPNAARAGERHRSGDQKPSHSQGRPPWVSSSSVDGKPIST